TLAMPSDFHASNEGADSPSRAGRRLTMTYGNLLSMGAAIAIATGGAALSASPASGKPPIVVTAPDPADVVTRHIGYSDLNLASPAGERTLSRRVDAAVSGLCSEAIGGDDGSPMVKFATQRCSNSALNQARPQIGLAVQRARDIAWTGSSSLAAAAIFIS